MKEKLASFLTMASVLGSAANDKYIPGSRHQGYQTDLHNPLYKPNSERSAKVQAEARAKQAAKEARRAARFG